MQLSARSCAHALLVFVLGCGAKSPLRVDPQQFAPNCVADRDCSNGLFCDGEEVCREGFCMPGPPIVCMDGDPCTDDVCNEDVHACVHSPATTDGDGDGHYGIRPGRAPGAPDACGDDCDDHNAQIHPGATELCNGRDDDCNGIVDDGATFAPAGPDVAVSEAGIAPSGPGGLAWAGDHYMSSYWGYAASKAHVYYSNLGREGMLVGSPPMRQFSPNPSDAYGAALAWTGRELGAVWQDRRTGDFEIFFNRYTPDGEPLGPDQRVTFADGFSVNPSITWTGSEYVLAWEDERDSRGSGGYEIYAQRIFGDGRQIGENLRLTNDPANSESPVIVMGLNGLGLVWLDGRVMGPGDPSNPLRAIWFATYTTDFRRMSRDERLTELSANASAPTLAWNRDRWVAAWHDADMASPDHEIWGITVDGGGVPNRPAQRLTHDTGFSRYASLVPLGNRLLLVWADDRVGPGYDLWAAMLGSDLSALTRETQVTSAPRDSVYPVPALGPDGDVGILFGDQRNGRMQVRFTRLTCAIPR